MSLAPAFSTAFDVQHTSWATVDQAHRHWPDSSSIPDATLQTLLDVATIQCRTFAPLVEDVPSNYMLGCVYQARELSAAATREGDIIGLGDYAIRARPLTATVKSLLRPHPGIPVTG